MQELQELPLLAFRDVKKYTSASIVCGKSYDQMLKETVADYQICSAEYGETIEGRHRKRQSSLAGLEFSAVTFIPRGVPQAAACDRKKRINLTNVNRKPQGNFLFLFQD